MFCPHDFNTLKSYQYSGIGTTFTHRNSQMALICEGNTRADCSPIVGSNPHRTIAIYTHNSNLIFCTNLSYGRIIFLESYY